MRAMVEVPHVARDESPGYERGVRVIRLRTLLALASALLLGCHGEDAPRAPATDGPDATAPSASPYTLRPDKYSRECARDEDCVLVQAVTDCGTCCGFVSVRRGEAERDVAAVQEACRQRATTTSPGGGSCGMYCGSQRAACFDQTCVKLPADGGT